MLRRLTAILVILAALAATLPSVVAQVAPLSPTRLEGVWNIVSYHDGAAIVSPADVFGKPGWVIFRDDGHLDGTPGCGSLVGDYSIGDGAITIRAGTFLTGSCFGLRDGNRVDLFNDSTHVTDAFNRANTANAKGDELVLHAADGTVMATLAPRN